MAVLEAKLMRVWNKDKIRLNSVVSLTLLSEESAAGITTENDVVHYGFVSALEQDEMSITTVISSNVTTRTFEVDEIAEQYGEIGKWHIDVLQY